MQLGPVALAFDGVMKVNELCPDNHSLSGTGSNIVVRKKLRNRIWSSAARANPRGPAAEVTDTAVGKAVSRRQT